MVLLFLNLLRMNCTNTANECGKLSERENVGSHDRTNEFVLETVATCVIIMTCPIIDEQFQYTVLTLALVQREKPVFPDASALAALI